MSDRPERYFLRIPLFHRLLHGVLMLSFLGLAATGLPLRFHSAPWAAQAAALLGGFGAILALHKLLALALSLAFLTHLGYVFHLAFVRRQSGVFWGPNSMVPQPKDLRDLVAEFRWFFGRGPQPQFDRFTYWEKFDYWAVFWGMAIIGISGYMLWFSGFFARFLPGWAFNIALLVHSEEALLAVWFIFAIHFFNNHLRPGKFPMDPVIFTGRVSDQVFRTERPLEYQRLEEGGRLEGLQADPPYQWLRNFAHLLGFSALAIGFLLFGLTLLAL
jgi:cytochrome b subunit of formate dehydrogenase